MCIVITVHTSLPDMYETRGHTLHGSKCILGATVLQHQQSAVAVQDFPHSQEPV